MLEAGVAVLLVGGAGAHQRDTNRKWLAAQVFALSHLHHFGQIVLCVLVHPAAALARVARRCVNKTQQLSKINYVNVCNKDARNGWAA